MVEIQWNGVPMVFETHPALFSPGGLDAGTRAMLEQLRLEPDEKALDLGCGWGIVGIYLAKQLGAEHVWMCDKDARAVAFSQRNARLNEVPGIHIQQSDGFTQLDETGFTRILSNPPYHTDFSVAKHFIEKGFNRLAVGGHLHMVTRRKTWYRNRFIAIFGGVRITETPDGYYVFEAEKRSMHYAGAKPR